MKILIFSDSHGKIQYMQKAMDRHSDCDYIVHLGDGADDVKYLTLPEKAVYIGVKGNCDAGVSLPSMLVESFGGVRTLICHGDRAFVKSSLAAYEAVARENGVSAALFGHTHQKHLEYRNGIYFFNPGSVGKYTDGDITYGIMTVQNGQALFSHGSAL